MMQEPQTLDLSILCWFIPLIILAHVSEDASLYNDISHQKYFFNHNLWDHLLIYLSPILFLGDIGIFSIGIQSVTFGPHYLMPYMCPETFSPSISVHISYCKISKSKYTVQDTLHCLPDLITMSTRLLMLMGKFIGIFKSQSGLGCKKKKILNSIHLNKRRKCSTYKKKSGSRTQVRVK